MKPTLESRLERARKLHKDGYNCSQCVAMVFDDIIGLNLDIIARISSGFGGGIGGQHQACGAVSGMTMIIGAKKFNTPACKPDLYKTVQKWCNEFKQINGSIICNELLQPGRKPCMELIEDAITIIHHRL